MRVAGVTIIAAALTGCAGNVHLHHDGRSYADLAWPQRPPVAENEIVTLANSNGTATVSLVGANVFSYVPVGSGEILFSAGEPDFASAEFQHAGIPIVWPWFNMNGEAGTPAHGFARQMKWSVVEKAESENVSRLVLELVSDDWTRKVWPYDFRLIYTITLCDRLLLSLVTVNTGDMPFKVTEGLHAYFSVSDVDAAVLRGLDGCRSDSGSFCEINPKFEGDLLFHAGENRVFTPGKGEYVLFDEGEGRAICMAARGHRKLVLWSIPESLCAGQFSGDDWKHFACLEPAILGRESAETILPGKRHELLMSVKAVKLK